MKSIFFLFARRDTYMRPLPVTVWCGIKFIRMHGFETSLKLGAKKEIFIQFYGLKPHFVVKCFDFIRNEVRL